MHDRSLVASTDGTASVMQVVGVSASNKFYIPTNDASGTSRLSNDQVYCGGTRQSELAQELNTIGYYIVTIDGSAVTVDFYSAPVYPTYAGGEYLISTVPTLNFTAPRTLRLWPQRQVLRDQPGRELLERRRHGTEWHEDGDSGGETTATRRPT